MDNEKWRTVSEMSAALKQATYDMYQQVFIIINYSVCKLSFKKQKHWCMSCPKDCDVNDLSHTTSWNEDPIFSDGLYPEAVKRMFNFYRKL
jgi:hypothetical protein